MEINFDLNKEKDSKVSQAKTTKKVNKNGEAYATGKRKTAIARVWIKYGKGNILVRTQDGDIKIDKYFKFSSNIQSVKSPLIANESEAKFDVLCTVTGGGTTAQSEAIRHGISKALNILDTETYRPALKVAGFLTRDSRIVERKKYGRRKARKKTQFSKR